MSEQWIYHKDDFVKHFNDYVITEPGKTMLIARVFGSNFVDAHSHARLIAAAPVLLKACKKQNEELAYAVDLLKGDAPVEWLAVIGNAQAVIATTKGKI